MRLILRTETRSGHRCTFRQRAHCGHGGNPVRCRAYRAADPTRRDRVLSRGAQRHYLGLDFAIAISSAVRFATASAAASRTASAA